MAIELVRKPSETPNINNHDDYRMFRYATGGYNGVNEKYGNKCSYEIDGSNFKIKSGEIIIDGVQARIDASGETITVDTITGTQYYSVYCEINLSLIDNQKVQIKSTYDTVDYPTIDKGDDLTESQTGIARLELYRFTANSGVISTVARRFNLIEIGQVKNAENATNSINAENAIVNYDETYSGFTKDECEILKTNNEIISRKVLLWENSTGDPIRQIIFPNATINANDVLEVLYQWHPIGGDNNGIHYKKIQINNNGFFHSRGGPVIITSYGGSPYFIRVEFYNEIIGYGNNYLTIGDNDTTKNILRITFENGTTGTVEPIGGDNLPYFLKVYKIIE